MERDNEALVGTDRAGTQPGRGEEATEMEALDQQTHEAIGNFKASVHAWSDAMVSRPRWETEGSRSKTWRLKPGWVLGCVVFAGAVSGGLYQNYHQEQLARIAAAREAEHQRQIAAERAREEEDLLAKVDGDISREVPNAMEPLASLMEEESK
jgi:hypothetical protein